LIGLKLLGALLITLSSAAAGYGIIEFKRMRVKEIEEMKKAVSCYKGCVSAMGYGVQEAFFETSNRVSGAVKDMFITASEGAENKSAERVDEIWKSAVKKCFDNSFFSKEDLDTVNSFGIIPGFMDTKQQCETADIVISELGNKEELLRKKLQSEEKMFRSSGVLCGILLSILLF